MWQMNGVNLKGMTGRTCSVFTVLTNPTISQKCEENLSQDNWFLATISSMYISVLYVHRHISSLQHEQETTPRSPIPPSPNPHNTMAVYTTEYSTSNYLNQQCRVLFQKFMYFRMVEKFSPFDGMQRFTARLHPGSAESHPQLTALNINMGCPNKCPTHTQNLQKPPTAILMHCN